MTPMPGPGLLERLGRADLGVAFTFLLGFLGMMMAVSLALSAAYFAIHDRMVLSIVSGIGVPLFAISMMASAGSLAWLSIVVVARVIGRFRTAA